MTLRKLPNFLKEGDPALTYPLGKSYTTLHPNGVPNGPYPNDPQAERERIAVAHFSTPSELCRIFLAAIRY